MEIEAMYNPNKFVLSTLVLVVGVIPVYAQSNVDTGIYVDAEAAIGHDDNIYRVTDELAQSDSYLRIKPKIGAIGGTGKHRFSLSYSGDYAKFSDNSDADFYDHEIRGRVDLEHSLRFGTQFEAYYQKDHEDPGSINRVQLNISEYNKYDQKFYLAGLTYGSAQAVGRFALNYSRIDKDYTTNGLDFLDFVADRLLGKFTYRVAPNTRLYVELTATDFDYNRTQEFELDNTYKTYRAGVSWDFSSKLSGDVNVGYQDRNYQLGSLQDISGLAYDGNITWAINTYTKIQAEASRESLDSSLEEVGGFLRTSYAISLSHELTELLKASFDVGYANDDLIFNGAREDERYAYQLSLDYQMSRNITIGAEYTFEKRDSTLSIANYDVNIFALNLKVSLDN